MATESLALQSFIWYPHRRTLPKRTSDLRFTVGNDRGGVLLPITASLAFTVYPIRRGWAVEAGYTDADRAALQGHRPQFDALKDAVAAGSIDVVVTYNLDRLTRWAPDALGLADLLTEHGVGLATVIDTSGGALKVLRMTGALSAS